MSEQESLAGDMLQFLESSPLGSDIECMRNKDFLFHFEAERHLILKKLLHDAGINSDAAFSVLDFGYLHGLTQEFLHRAFPRSHITVFDRPSSPIFKNVSYMNAVNDRKYLTLTPRNIEDLNERDGKYRVIILGEIIEHLDPSQVAKSLATLRKIVEPDGILVITTPNAAGLYNCYMTMTGGDSVQVPPIPDPTMGYGHIHLWSPALLTRTAEYCGWKCNAVKYYHGRDGEKFEVVKRSWGSLKTQLMVRSLKFLGNRKPALKSFFVASFLPA